MRCNTSDLREWHIQKSAFTIGIRGAIKLKENYTSRTYKLSSHFRSGLKRVTENKYNSGTAQKGMEVGNNETADKGGPIIRPGSRQ